MSKRLRTIKLSPESELARALKAAGSEPVLVETNGERFRVEREAEDVWAGYDPAEVSAALDRYEGVWADLDTEAMIRELLAARAEGSRPADRP